MEQPHKQQCGFHGHVIAEGFHVLLFVYGDNLYGVVTTPSQKRKLLIPSHRCYCKALSERECRIENHIEDILILGSLSQNVEQLCEETSKLIIRCGEDVHAQR